MDLNSDTDTPMLHPKEAQGRKLPQYAAAISASLGALCAGSCLAWTSPALAQLTLDTNSTLNVTTTNPEAFYVSEKEAALIGGILSIGALIAAIPTGYFADKFGRKKIILLLSLFFLLNWILIIFAPNALTIIVGRFFAGIGTGGICVAASIYIGEIAESSIRGSLGALVNMLLCLGILVTCIFGSFTGWRTLSGILAVVPVIFGISFLFAPESPLYLIGQDQEEAAEKSLTRLRGVEYKNLKVELTEIRRQVEESRSNSAKGGVGEIFKSRPNRRAFTSVVVVSAFQQLCGVNAVVFYTVPIFKAAGIALSPDLIAIMISLVQVSFSYISIVIIEKANRKFYLLISSTGMMLCLLALATYFHLMFLNVNVSSLAFLPIAGAVLFMVSFSVGYGPVPWLLMGELFPNEIKGVGNGIAILINWGCAFLVTFFFPIITASVGSHVAFYSLASLMGVATVFVYFVVPETKGRSLLEIQEMLAK